MTWKRLISALIALSFVLAGVPGPSMAAGVPCPMVESSAVQALSQHEMSMEDCQDCPESAKTQKEKAEKKNVRGGCCDDAACNAKCTAAGSAASLLFPSGVFQWAARIASKKPEPISYLPLPSQLRKTPERPPKRLS